MHILSALMNFTHTQANYDPFDGCEGKYRYFPAAELCKQMVPSVLVAPELAVVSVF